MEKLLPEKLQKHLDELKERSKQNKETEYRGLYVSVTYAAAKDGFIRKIGARAFGVFMVIRSYMDKDNVAYPALDTIAYLSGCGVSTVQKEIDILITHQWIQKIGRVKNPNGRFGNTKYQILENDLVRGTGQRSFIESPSVKYTNGD